MLNVPYLKKECHWAHCMASLTVYRYDSLLVGLCDLELAPALVISQTNRCKSVFCTTAVSHNQTACINASPRACTERADCRPACLNNSKMNRAFSNNRRRTTLSADELITVLTLPAGSSHIAL